MEKAADVILTHAGAGTLLEALAVSSSATPTVIDAVIHPTLMHDHPLELAEELERRGNIRVTRDCTADWTAEDGATRCWEVLGAFALVSFVRGAAGADGRRCEQFSDARR